MTDLEKQKSAADSKKKSSSIGDDDFGKEFLSFWGSSKKGKDTIDLDVEEVPRNKKKSFNFDKLDDFELGGVFGKLPSFKMDMPDLDFDSPATKTDKPTEKPTGNQESKQDKFSFNFDFPEFGGFDLDPSPDTCKKNPSKIADGYAPDDSSKHGCDREFRSNSGTSSDVFKDQKSSKSPKTDMKATSGAHSLVQPSNSGSPRPSISQDLGHHDMSHNVSTSRMKQITKSGEKNETHSEEYHKDQPEGITGLTTEKSTEDFIHRSVSGDCLARESLPQLQIRPSSSNAVKDDSAMEEDVNVKPVESSQSRNSSPVNSYKTRYLKTNLSEPQNDCGDFQKHCQWNQDEVSSKMEVQGESIQVQLDNQNTPFTDISQKTAYGGKNTRDYQKTESKLIPSLLLRDSRSCKSVSLNEKLTASLQSKALSKPKVTQRTSPETKKQLNFIHNNESETLDICLDNDNRESTHYQAGTDAHGILMPYEKGPAQSSPDVSSGKGDGGQSDSSSSQFKTSNLEQQNTASSTAKSTISKLVSGTASVKCFKTSPVESSAISLKDNRKCNTGLTISSTTNLNSKMPNSAAPKETKLVGFSDSSLRFPLNTASKKNSIITEKPGTLNLLLKRKTFEEPAADPETVKPLKFSMENASERESLGVSPEVENPVVTQKEDNSLDNCKLKAMNITPVNNNREAKQNHVQTETQKTGILKLYDKMPAKGISVSSARKKNDVCEPSGFQLKTASLQQQIIPRNSPKSIIANFVSSIASKKNSKIVPVENKESSPKDEKTFVSRLTIPRTQISATAKETKLVRFSEGSSDFLLRTSTKIANSVFKEKDASMNNSRKRKTSEDSMVHLEKSNPLKCIKESPTRWKQFELSPNVGRAVVPIIQNLEVCHADNCSEDLASNVVPELEASTHVEVLAPTDKDQTVEQAKVWAKELDYMSNLMKKKNDEAKDLLVRAIVNHNELLMLNHPLWEEKIHSLQRFANSLQHRKF